MNRAAVILACCMAGLLAGCGDGEADQKSSDTARGTGSTESTPKAKTADKGMPNEDAGGDSPQPGVFAGRIQFEGEVPPPRKIQVTKDVEHCKSAAGEIQDVVVSEEGFLSGAVVEIQGVKRPETGWDWKEPEGGYTIRQKGCRFAPKITVAHDGAKLTIHNDDPVAHNINTGQWNVVQGKGAGPIENSIRYAGQPFVRVTCNIHGWMETWVYVARSPYYSATAEDGRFRIEGLPPGKYRATAIHPTLGKQRLRVTIEPGQTAEQDIVFQAPGSGKS